jgi:hypothetical protein
MSDESRIQEQGIYGSCFNNNGNHINLLGKSRIQEHGMYGSCFISNGNHINLFDAFCEKVDNSIDAMYRKTDNSNGVNVTLQYYSSGIMVYVDNIGMDPLDFKNYGDFYRSSNNQGVGIGKHGVGGKVGDYQLGGSNCLVVHISNNDGYRCQIWDFNKMDIDYNSRNNHVLTNNIKDSPDFNTLEELINYIQDSISNFDIDIENIVSPYFDIGNHTVTIYCNEDHDTLKTIWDHITSPDNKKNLGIIYSPLLRDENENGNYDLKIIFKSENRTDEVPKFDILRVNDLCSKYGDIIDGKISYNNYTIYEEVILSVFSDNDNNYYIDFSKIRNTTTKSDQLPKNNNYYKLGIKYKKIVPIARLPDLDNPNPSSYIKLTGSCVWPLAHTTTDNSQTYGGFHLLKNGRRQGKSFYPPKVRANENGAFRFTIEIEDHNLDPLIGPGINKNKISPNGPLKNICRAFYNRIRDPFPKTEKEFKTKCNDTPNNEQTNDGIEEATNDDTPNNEQTNDDSPNNEQTNDDTPNNEQTNDDTPNNEQTNDDTPNNEQTNYTPINEQTNDDTPNNEQTEYTHNNEPTEYTHINEQTNYTPINEQTEYTPNNEQTNDTPINEQTNNDIPSAGQYGYREGCNVLLPKKWTNKKKFNHLKLLLTSCLSKINNIDIHSLDDINEEYDPDFVKSCDNMKETIDNLLVE